jgi:hypothetical protein
MRSPSARNATRSPWQPVRRQAAARLVVEAEVEAVGEIGAGGQHGGEREARAPGEPIPGRTRPQRGGKTRGTTHRVLSLTA